MSESMAQLSADLEAVLELVSQADGELDQGTEKRLDDVQAKISEKAEAIWIWAKAKRKAAEGLNELAQYYYVKSTARLRAASTVEKYLLAQLQRQGRDKVETPLFTIKRAKIGKPVIDVDFGKCCLEDFPAGATEKVPESLKFVKAGALRILRRSERIPIEVGTHSVAFPGGGHVVVQVKERLSVT